MRKSHHHGGYTLVELVVSVGIFAIIMTLAAGVYLLMISISRQAQASATGVDNLAFALETMTRVIRTGTQYGCNSTPFLDGSPCSTNFSVRGQDGFTHVFNLSSGSIQMDGIALTDPSITVTTLSFYLAGSPRTPTDFLQPQVVILTAGNVSTGKATLPFAIETSATMRGPDL